MTHEEALKEAVRKIWVPMWQEADTGTVLQLIDETVFELGQAIAAYLEARGAVLVPEKMTMPMLNAVMKFHRSLPAGKQTIAASTEYQTAELVWDAALSALSDNPKGDGNGR